MPPTDVHGLPDLDISHGRRLIAANALVGYVGAVGLTGLRFVTKLVLIRSLDPADFGRVITTQNLQAIVVTVASLNLGDAVLRFVGLHAQDRTGRAASVIRHALGFVVPAGIAGTLILAAASTPLAARLGLGAEGSWGVTLAALALVPLLVGDTIGASFQGLNRTWVKVGLLDMPRSLVTLAGYGTLAALGWATFAGVIAVQLAAALVASALMLIAYRRTPRLRTPQLAPSHVRTSAPVSLRELLTYSVPMFISLVIGGTLVGSGIPLVLAAQEAPEAVALFAVALTLAPLLELPAGALEGAAVPVWAAAHTGARRELKRSFTEITRWGLLLALVVFVPLMMAPREWLALLFGGGYAGPAAAVQLALAATLCAVALGPAEGMLLASGVTRGIVLARVVSGALALAVAWPLVAAWGVVGAIAAWGGSTVVSNLISGVYVFRQYGIHPFDRRYAATAASGAAAAAMCGAIIWAGPGGKGELLAIAAASLATVTLVGWGLGAWTPAELRRLVRKSPRSTT